MTQHIMGAEYVVSYDIAGSTVRWVNVSGRPLTVTVVYSSAAISNFG